MFVIKTVVRPSRLLLLICALLASGGLWAQRERQLQPQPQEESAYGSKFFDQLRSIFGRFRDADLRHAFEVADAIQCSELVVDKGEWRTVAFFNEDRSLGEWCRNNLDEVKTDLAVYIFKGQCQNDRGTIQVSTEFPVSASIEAYNDGKISLDQIDINVNAPVSVVFDPSARTYVFELPYLFLVGRRSSGNVYSLDAERVEDSYAPDVTSHWECKAVKSEDVTYRFLICHAATVARNTGLRSRNRDLAFGASAYFILSDGIEAQTSVNLSYGDAARPVANPPTAEPAAPPVARPALTRSKTPARVGDWQLPDVGSKIVDAGKNEFRLRFSPQTWAGKIGSQEILSDQKMSSLLAARLPEGGDYCGWSPGDASLVEGLLTNPPDADVTYSMEAFDKSGRSPASILFDVKTHSGTVLGALRCIFPHAESAATITFDRWVSIVGGHLTLEIRR